MSLLSQSKLYWIWASWKGQNKWEFAFHTCHTSIVFPFHTDIIVNEESIQPVIKKQVIQKHEITNSFLNSKIDF